MCRLNVFIRPILDSFLGIHRKIVTNYNNFYFLPSQSTSKDNRFLAWLCEKYIIELLNTIQIALCSFKITQQQHLNLKRICLLRKLSAEVLMLLNCGAGEDSWESLGLQGDPPSPSSRRSVLGVHCKDWCWSWNSNILATWCEELTHLKRPWCWKRSRAGGEGDDRGWNGWMASLTQWTWVWVDSRSWWWTGRPGVLQSMGSLRAGHDWVTELTCLLRNKASFANLVSSRKYHLECLSTAATVTIGFGCIHQ